MPVREYRLESVKRTEFNQKILEFSKEFDIAHHNIFIYGPVGCGKTHIATGIIRRYRGFVLKTRELMDLLRLGRDNLELSESAILRLSAGFPLSTASFYHPGISGLVLDDLGYERSSEYLISKIYDLIETRLNADRNGLIVTSNLSLDDLAVRLGNDRISSRLAQMCQVFSLEGEKDFRMRGANAQQ